MDKEDYKKIGLKVGIEIHQQLDTHKLFCDCPSILRQDEPDFKVKRKLQAVSGEEGKKDVAAEYEQYRDRNFIYEGYNDTTCLVELDEEPPHEINQEALKIALQLALMLNCQPNEVIQVMRKTVVNGSNTSGFQRTLLLASDGWLEIDGKKIGIQTICLEEDACKTISENEREVVYRLDRLGIPLVEIATAPDIRDPEEAKKVSLRIGEILRACKVKRGLGTIRQDVNMSILGKERTEIKGVQEPDLIVKTLDNEIRRQKELIDSKKQIGNEVRKANADGTTLFLRPLPGKARMYPETDVSLIILNKKFIDEIKHNLPKIRLKEDIIKELEQKGINTELAKAILQRGQIELFENLLKTNNDAKTIAKLIAVTPDSVKAHYKLDDSKFVNLTEEVFKEILFAIKKEEISKDALENVLYEFVMNNNLKNALQKNKKLSKQELGKEIDKFLEENKDKIKTLPEKTIFGMLIGRLKGKADSQEIMETLDKAMKK